MAMFHNQEVGEKEEKATRISVEIRRYLCVDFI